MGLADVPRRRNPAHATFALAMVSVVAWPGSGARADEGGVSFWVPGQYGSFAAIAPDPGFSLPVIGYFYSGSAGAHRTFQRGGSLNAGIKGRFDSVFLVPTYTPDTMILGARPSFSLTFIGAYSKASSDAQLNTVLGPFAAARSDSITAMGDVYPTAQLFWNAGVNNAMAYITGNIPVGAYNANRLANIGLGHGAVDIGGAYTYLNTKTGLEFSATAGLTFNLKNPSTNQTSGIDFHLDWAASQFLSQQFFVGVAGYVYQQLTPDRGQPAILGDFKSRTLGVGPQIGYNFNVGNGVSIYTNLRAYWEFDVQNRLRGNTVLLTVNLPFSALAKSRAAAVPAAR